MLDKEIKKDINRLLRDIKFNINLKFGTKRNLDQIKFDCEMIGYYIKLQTKRNYKV
jgi:hypothetical protein|tara:strand:- start:56 stop:223 length:168 start_codon:yes stop_codon:yes gene_type:complete